MKTTILALLLLSGCGSVTADIWQEGIRLCETHNGIAFAYGTDRPRRFDIVCKDGATYEGWLK